MKIIYNRCCAIDVRKKLMVACFIQGEEQETREFGVTTDDFLELADWLQSGGCEMASMESTVSYWKPLYNILELSGLKAIVVDASRLKNLPARKANVNDAQWMATLLQYDLYRARYIPERSQRVHQELVGYRKSLVAYKTRELNRLQEMLEGANIKLSGSVSEINGKSDLKIIDLILSGEKVNEAMLVQMKRDGLIAYNLKIPIPQLTKNLNGILSPMQKKIMREIIKHIDELDEHISNLSD